MFHIKIVGGAIVEFRSTAGIAGTEGQLRYKTVFVPFNFFRETQVQNNCFNIYDANFRDITVAFS